MVREVDKESKEKRGWILDWAGEARWGRSPKLNGQDKQNGLYCNSKVAQVFSQIGQPKPITHLKGKLGKVSSMHTTSSFVKLIEQGRQSEWHNESVKGFDAKKEDAKGAGAREKGFFFDYAEDLGMPHHNQNQPFQLLLMAEENKEERKRRKTRKREINEDKHHAKRLMHVLKVDEWRLALHQVIGTYKVVLISVH